jgi:hypothetical protein
MSAEDEAMLKAYTPDPEIGLFGGRWVPNGRGTVVWQQERQPAPKPVEPKSVKKAVLCRHCLQPFERTRNRIGYCSDECKAEGRIDQQRSYDASKRKGKRASEKCTDCGSAVYARSKRCKPCSLEVRGDEGRWAA